MEKMKKIDMRCRPPVGSIAKTWFYGSNLDGFAHKFGGGVIPLSAKKKDLNLLMEEMKEENMQGFVCLRRNGNPNANKDVAPLLKEHGDMFYGAIGVDLYDMELVMSDIDEYVINGPFIGVNIEPDCPPAGHEDTYMYLDDERISPIYQKCMDNNIPVTFTYGGPISDIEYKNPIHLVNVLNNFPTLRVCLTHGGWPLFNTYILGIAAGNPNLFISADSYMLGLPGWRDYVDAANTLCPDQICFGTSYPLNSIQHVVNFYENAGFRPEVMQKVYYDNAARFLGLKAADDREPTEVELIVQAMAESAQLMAED